MGLATNVEVDHGNKGSVFFYGSAGCNAENMSEWAPVRYDEVNDKTSAAIARGSGMIVSCQRGAGQIFNAGTCEWVAGLKLNDADTTIITRNVLERFSQEVFDG